MLCRWEGLFLGFATRLASQSGSSKAQPNKAAANGGFGNLAPHHLRRTCTRLCHQAGGELEQIQFLLGHVSVQTTE